MLAKGAKGGQCVKVPLYYHKCSVSAVTTSSGSLLSNSPSLHYL